MVSSSGVSDLILFRDSCNFELGFGARPAFVFFGFGASSTGVDAAGAVAGDDGFDDFEASLNLSLEPPGVATAGDEATGFGAGAEPVLIFSFSKPPILTVSTELKSRMSPQKNVKLVLLICACGETR